MRNRDSIVGTEGDGARAGTGWDDYPHCFAESYAKSDGQKYGLSLADFAAILCEVSERYLPPGASQAEPAELHASLRLEDLVLARACARGNEQAWEDFLNQYRQKLYAAAAAIAREESAARELAGGLYADLFGIRRADDGGRIS